MGTGFRAILLLVFGILRAALLRRIRRFAANYFLLRTMLRTLSGPPSEVGLLRSLIGSADFLCCLLNQPYRKWQIPHILGLDSHSIELP